MSGAVFAADADTLNRVTDLVGITAVVIALGLLLRLDAAPATGRTARRSWRVGALAVTGFALVVVGGRFSWLPDAPTDRAAADEAAADAGDGPNGADAGEDTASSPSTTADGGETDDGVEPTDPSVIGPPAPTTEPQPPETTAPPTTAAPSEPGPDPPAPAPSPDPAPDPSAPEPAQPDRADASASYVVVEGDNFWSIAEDRLEAETGGSVSDADVVPYWQSLIEANVDVLVQPGNADLILPGQTLDLPPPPAPAPG